MRRGWLILLVAGSASAAPRKGKVVRVERERGAAAPPIICDVAIDHSSNCIGDEPHPGDVITLVDENGPVGEARLTEVTPLVLGSHGGKGCDGLWQGKTELLRGDLSGGGSRTVGIIDPQLMPRQVHLVPKEQLVAPSGRADDVPAIGFDRDGDKVPDVILSQGSCDGSGSICIEMWVRIGGQMQRVRQVNFQNCGL